MAITHRVHPPAWLERRCTARTRSLPFWDHAYGQTGSEKGRRSNRETGIGSACPAGPCSHFECVLDATEGSEYLYCGRDRHESGTLPLSSLAHCGASITLCQTECPDISRVKQRKHNRLSGNVDTYSKCQLVRAMAVSSWQTERKPPGHRATQWPISFSVSHSDPPTGRSTQYVFAGGRNRVRTRGFWLVSKVHSVAGRCRTSPDVASSCGDYGW